MEFLSSLLKNRIFLWSKGLLMYGIKGRSEIELLKKEIANLEAKNEELRGLVFPRSNISISGGTFNININPDGKTRKVLEETMDKLGRNDLGKGNEYAHLPDGSKLVSLADGSYRIGMPIEVKLEPVVMKLVASGKVEVR
ncbi:MAG: hypothetical protein OXE56_02150 [Gammaproteobacteria bacterium]|nr:hypothetical protein [Gammaproteobacteria bacterium]